MECNDSKASQVNKKIATFDRFTLSYHIKVVWIAESKLLLPGPNEPHREISLQDLKLYHCVCYHPNVTKNLSIKDILDKIICRYLCQIITPSICSSM